MVPACVGEVWVGVNLEEGRVVTKRSKDLKIGRCHFESRIEQSVELSPKIKR